MKTSVRLLIHETCNRFCAMCCNQTDLHDLDNLPIITTEQIRNAKEFILTGGETMINPLKVITIARMLRHTNPACKIYMYTAKTRPAANLIAVLPFLDGITVTLHEPQDILNFEEFQNWLTHYPYLAEKTCRLNYFPEEGVNVSNLDLEGWVVDAIEWLEDCPLPENEVFLRWSTPTKLEHIYRRKYFEKNSPTPLDIRPIRAAIG